MTNRPWAAKDLTALNDLYIQGRAEKEIAILLERSIKSVSRKLDKLGIRKATRTVRYANRRKEEKQKIYQYMKENAPGQFIPYDRAISFRGDEASSREGRGVLSEKQRHNLITRMLYELRQFNIPIQRCKTSSESLAEEKFIINNHEIINVGQLLYRFNKLQADLGRPVYRVPDFTEAYVYETRV